MKIVFFGTSDFAVPSLKELQTFFSIEAVVTAPDKRGGRGRRQLIESPVKRFSIVHQLAILQPSKLKSPEFIDKLKSIDADLFVVVAFRMLPEIVWSMPKMGTVNLHASILPKFRGAAPINHAIIQGEQYTGLSIFKIDHRIDTGDLLCTKKIQIGTQETFGELHDRMALTGGKFLVECLTKFKLGETTPVKQDHSKASHAPKLTKDFCKLDFSLPAQLVLNKIRGLSPYPGAFTILFGLEFKIYKAEINPNKELSKKSLPGKIATDGKNWLAISCSNGWIDCQEVQLQGKKRMEIKDFLNGFGKNMPEFLG